MKKLLFPIVILFALLACEPPAVMKPPIHVPTDTDRCPAACQRLEELKCEESIPVPKSWCADDSIPKRGKCLDGSEAGDLTCLRFCVRTQNAGHALTPSCIEHINSCAEMDTLDVTCKLSYKRKTRRSGQPP